MKNIVVLIILSLTLALALTYMYSVRETNVAFKALVITMWAVFVLSCALAVVSSVEGKRKKQG